MRFQEEILAVGTLSGPEKQPFPIHRGDEQETIFSIALKKDPQETWHSFFLVLGFWFPATVASWQNRTKSGAASDLQQLGSPALQGTYGILAQLPGLTSSAQRNGRSSVIFGNDTISMINSGKLRQ